MSVGIAISVEEYLATSYRPDCDYLEGATVERNVGDRDHSRMQISLGSYLFNREQDWNITALTEQRVQVRASRFRVPDITVVAGTLPEHVKILHDPPLLCIEILSPDDSMESMQERIDDYLAFGVPCVWVVNPRSRRGYICDADSMHEARDGVLRVAGTPIAVPIAELA
jgi:Uma2 family endonuclease